MVLLTQIAESKNGEKGREKEGGRERRGKATLENVKREVKQRQGGGGGQAGACQVED